MSYETLYDEIMDISEEELKEIRESISDEEVDRIEREVEEQRKKLKKAKKRIMNAKTKKSFLEAISEALKVCFGDMADEIMIQSPDDERNPTEDWHLVWEGGSPFQWAVEFTGRENWFGVEGHLDNDKFYLEPHWSFSLSVGLK